MAVAVLSGCVDTESPVIVETTRLTDTSDTVGPYEVLASVRDDRGILEVNLWWGPASAPQTGQAFTKTPMSQVAEGKYRGLIPSSADGAAGFPPGSTIRYFVEAVDNDNNRTRDPPEGAFAFRVLPPPNKAVNP
ncbi:MAG: hypothetical protein GMKNLPBB_01098 [Myxococcota bacterium]|nr:hypothetical protein [Myxococcota bacterium]